MDLFYVNRYEEGQETTTKDEEANNLHQLLEKIEIKKRKKKNKEDVAEKIENTRKRRKEKREFKAKIVEVPEIDMSQFIDQAVTEAAEVDTQEEPLKKISKLKNDLPTSFEGFTVLGSQSSSKKEKVKRVLPKWLAKPTLISTDLKELRTKVSSMKVLDADIRRKLKENGMKYLFPVQAEIIPWLLQSVSYASEIRPRDICVSAPTGSGKTLAFVLPVIQALKSYGNKKIRALVILPTQDLALQVFRTFKMYCEETNLDVCFITRENTFASEQKFLVDDFPYQNKADIVVCTPGRLVDHLINTKNLDLQDLEFLVIDEADRILDNVQNDWLYHLDNHLKKTRIEVPSDDILLNALKKWPPQKLLFSATLSQDPEKLQKIALYKPKLFTSVVEGTSENMEAVENDDSSHFIGKYTTPNELSEKYIVCPAEIKPLILYNFLKSNEISRTLVFTNSFEETHRLSILLGKLFKDDRKIVEMNSHLGIEQRKKLIANFSKGSIDIIICTDALARGIDLPEVKCVVSYSAPKHVTTYIHRAGRTARAGSFGTAVTLVHTTQVNHFKSLLERAKKHNVDEVIIPSQDLEASEETYTEALEEMKEILSKEKEEKLNNIKNTKRTFKTK